MQAEHDRAIVIQDLSKVVMGRRGLRLTKKRLVPAEATGNIADTDNCPSAYHCDLCYFNNISKNKIKKERKMTRLLSVNVGLPRDIEWKGRTVLLEGLLDYGKVERLIQPAILQTMAEVTRS